MASLFLNNSRYRARRIYCPVWAARANRNGRPTLVRAAAALFSSRTRRSIGAYLLAPWQRACTSSPPPPASKDERFIPRCTERYRRYHLITASVLGNWSSTFSGRRGGRAGANGSSYASRDKTAHLRDIVGKICRRIFVTRSIDSLVSFLVFPFFFSSFRFNIRTLLSKDYVNTTLRVYDNIERVALKERTR